MGFIDSGLGSDSPTSPFSSAAKNLSERRLSSREQMPPPSFKYPSYLKRKRTDATTEFETAYTDQNPNFAPAGSVQAEGDDGPSPQRRKLRNSSPSPGWEHNMICDPPSTSPTVPSSRPSSRMAQGQPFSLYPGISPPVQHSLPKTSTPVATQVQEPDLFSSFKIRSPEDTLWGPQDRPNSSRVSNSMIWSEAPQPYLHSRRTEVLGSHQHLPRSIAAPRSPSRIGIDRRGDAVSAISHRPQLISLLRQPPQQTDHLEESPELQHATIHDPRDRDNQPPEHDYFQRRNSYPTVHAPFVPAPPAPSKLPSRPQTSRYFNPSNADDRVTPQSVPYWPLPPSNHTGLTDHPARIKPNNSNPAFTTPLNRIYDLRSDQSSYANVAPSTIQERTRHRLPVASEYFESASQTRQPMAESSHHPAYTSPPPRQELHVQTSPLYHTRAEQGAYAHLPVLTRDMPPWDQTRPVSRSFSLSRSQVPFIIPELRHPQEHPHHHPQYWYQPQPHNPPLRSVPPSPSLSRAALRSDLPEHRRAIHGRPASSSAPHSARLAPGARLSLAPMVGLPPAFRPRGDGAVGGRLGQGGGYAQSQALGLGMGMGQDPLTFFRANRGRVRLR